MLFIPKFLVAGTTFFSEYMQSIFIQLFILIKVLCFFSYNLQNGTSCKIFSNINLVVAANKFQFRRNGQNERSVTLLRVAVRHAILLSSTSNLIIMWSDKRSNFYGWKKRVKRFFPRRREPAEIRAFYTHPRFPGVIPDNGGMRGGSKCTPGGSMVTWNLWRYGSTTESTVVALSASLSRETRLSLHDLIVFTGAALCYHTRIRNVSSCSLTQQRDESASGGFVERDFTRNRLGEISYGVAVEISHNVVIVCV